MKRNQCDIFKNSTGYIYGKEINVILLKQEINLTFKRNWLVMKKKKPLLISDFLSASLAAGLHSSLVNPLKTEEESIIFLKEEKVIFKETSCGLEALAKETAEQ